MLILENNSSVMGWVMAAGVGAYGWQVHGLTIGAVAFVTFVGAVMATNYGFLYFIVMRAAEPDDDANDHLFMHLRWIRLAIFVAVLLVIGATGAESIQ